MKQQNFLLLPFFLLLFLVLSINPAFACRNPVWLFNAGELAGIAAFFIFLTGASADSSRAGRDMGIFFLVIVGIIAAYMILPYFSYLLVSPTGVSAMLFGFTIFFTVRVITQASEKPGYYSLLIFLPLLAYLVFSAPPLRVMIGHGQCSGNIGSLGTSLEMYAEKHKGKYPEKIETLVPEYLNEIPVCSVQGEFDENDPKYKLYVTRYNMKNTPYQYELNDDKTRFTLYCVSNNHIPYGFKWQYSPGKGAENMR